MLWKMSCSYRVLISPIKYWHFIFIKIFSSIVSFESLSNICSFSYPSVTTLFCSYSSNASPRLSYCLNPWLLISNWNGGQMHILAKQLSYFWSWGWAEYILNLHQTLLISWAKKSWLFFIQLWWSSNTSPMATRG